MNTSQYFNHARSLGAFTAEDCLSLARKAAAMDHAIKIETTTKPIVVWYEVNPDGTKAKFSQGIMMF